jgi:hypothetical protein
MKMIILINVLFTMIGCNLNNGFTKLQKEVAIQSYIDQNEKSYEDVYIEISNEVNRMKNDRLKSTLLNIIHESTIDKLIIFNKGRTKLYTTLNSSAKIYKNSSSDLIQSIYGVKIDGKWHVYLGNQNLIAMRDGYKTYKYEPFTWEELSYVAHEQMFGRYLKYTENEIAINYENLEHDTSVRSLTGKNLDEVESEEAAFIELTEYYNSRKLDSTEYQQLLEEINNPEPKERESIKKLTWWDKLWGAEVPVFDTKEWKEYLANKNQGK